MSDSANPSDDGVVIGTGGEPLRGVPVDTDGDGTPDAMIPLPSAHEGEDLTDLVSQPDKVMRIGSMIKQL